MENIEQYIDHQSEITIKREAVDDEPISAIPVKVSSRLLLIYYIYDFTFDGCKVLSVEDISEIQREEIDRFHSYIIQREGIVQGADVYGDMDIDTWQGVFRYLHEYGKMLDISLERIVDKQNFFVGKVDAIFDDHILLREVTALGVFKNGRKKIYYNDITMVSFANKYSEMLDKYGREYQKEKK